MIALQADSEANNRVKGLSKPEWVLLGLTLGLLICGDIGFTVVQIREYSPSFTLGDWKTALITALVCIALASVKLGSYVEVETVGERLLWAAKYAGFFLTFSKKLKPEKTQLFKKLKDFSGQNSTNR